MAITNCIFVDCSLVNPVADLYTTVELTPGIANLIQSVSVVQLNEYPARCFRVVKPGNVLPPALPYTIVSTFGSGNQADNCETCTETVIVYPLRNCLGPLHLPTMYTVNSQFAQAVDQVVNLVGYEGECWIVGQESFTGQTITDLEILANEQGVLQIFDDCVCCLPTPEPEPVKYTRVIPKPDRKFYQITQSQCDINANIKFAENYYRYFKKLKYGINSMCDNIDLDKVWIKKKLSDLAVITDPTACVIVTPPTPIICPEPS
jgi:hypothetical protein